MISISEKRPLKGSSLVALPLDYVALDIETTGLSPTFDEIIELSAVRVRGGKPVAEYTRLVKPSAPLDPYVSELTGITDEMLESAAPIAAELPAFFDFVAADVIVGHSVAYDVNFLYDSAERCGLSVPTNDYVDTLRLSRRLYADLPDHKLATVAQYLGVNQLPSTGASPTRWRPRSVWRQCVSTSRATALTSPRCSSRTAERAAPASTSPRWLPMASPTKRARYSARYAYLLALLTV